MAINIQTMTQALAGLKQPVSTQQPPRFAKTSSGKAPVSPVAPDPLASQFLKPFSFYA